jgi:predicted Zn-dependent peptidase
MYLNHPVKIDIAGTVESINTIDKEMLYKCYNTFYNPSNMVLSIVGDLDFEKIIEVVESSERKDLVYKEEINRIFPDEPEELNKKVVVQNMMTANTLFYMGFKDLNVGYIGEEKVKKDIVTNIILDMLFSKSSKFYNEFYETGLIDSSFSAYYTGKKTYGHSLIFGQSSDPQKVYDEIVKLIKKPIEEILDRETFIRIKRDNLGSFLMGLNSIEFIANNFTDLYFEDFLLTDYLDLMDKIKYEDILNRFKEHFKEDNLALSIINPLEQ